MPLGPQTSVINGQRYALPTGDTYTPASYGPTTTGVPLVTVSIPPGMGAAGTLAGTEGVGGYSTAGSNNIVTSIAGAHPFNPKLSPVLPAIVLLLLALVGLTMVNWRKVTLETGSESASLGGVRESAREEVT